jgi:hypothetical protein
MKKMLDKNNPENTVVYVIFRGKFNEKYECVGVLIREEKNSIRIVFNVKNDKVVDYVDIKRVDVISIEILDSSSIKKL